MSTLRYRLGYEQTLKEDVCPGTLIDAWIILLRATRCDGEFKAWKAFAADALAISWRISKVQSKLRYSIGS